DLDLWNNLVQLYLQTGQTGTAQKMVEDLLGRAPGLAGARVMLAGLYVATNQLDKARDQVKFLDANPPKDEQIAKQLEQVKLAIAIQGKDVKTVDSLPETTEDQKFLKA